MLKTWSSVALAPHCFRPKYFTFSEHVLRNCYAISFSNSFWLLKVRTEKVSNRIREQERDREKVFFWMNAVSWFADWLVENNQPNGCEWIGNRVAHQNDMAKPRNGLLWCTYTNCISIECETIWTSAAKRVRTDNYCAKLNRILLAKLFCMHISSLEFTIQELKMKTNCCCCDDNEDDNDNDNDNVEDNIS